MYGVTLTDSVLLLLVLHMSKLWTTIDSPYTSFYKNKIIFLLLQLKLSLYLFYVITMFQYRGTRHNEVVRTIKLTLLYVEPCSEHLNLIQ